MAASVAYVAIGTTFKWNATAIAELKSIGGIKMSVDKIDVTSFDSDDGFKEFKPGMFDGGSIDIEGFFLPSDTAGQYAMHTDFLARTIREAIITFPTAMATTWTFNGYITAYENTDATTDGAIGFKATIGITGKPTLGYSASTGGTFIVTGNNGAATVNPASAAGTYSYVVNLVAGATSYTVTPTMADGTITLVDATGASQTIVTGNASTSITAPSNGIHTIYLTNTGSGKVPKTYTITIVESV